MYYYNAKMNKSVWVKPQELIVAEAEARAAAVIAGCPWREHKAPDGRAYYHNKSTKQSVWKVPEELATARAEAARIRAAAGGGSPLEASSAPPSFSQTATSGHVAPAAAGAAAAASQAATGDFMYATKEEAKSAFKAFLTEAEPPLDSKWDAVEEILASRGDRRFSALKSSGERASCFKEWRADRRADAARSQEAAAAAQRAAFIKLLDEKAVVLMGARFSKAEAVCFEDPRWEALPEAQRKSTFQEWLEARRREAEAAARAATEAQVRFPPPAVCPSFVLEVCKHLQVLVSSCKSQSLPRMCIHAWLFTPERAEILALTANHSGRRGAEGGFERAAGGEAERAKDEADCRAHVDGGFERPERGGGL
jgi:pre-mRNA-processing factor 40